MTFPKRPRSRAPRGVCSDDRIQVALMPNELRAFDARAERDCISRSALARLFILLAMGVDPEKPTPPSRQRHTTSIAED